MTTPENTLTTAEKAGIVTLADPLNGISFAAYSAVSDNPGIAAVVDAGFSTVGVAGMGAGTATITVTRLADGATADLDVTVVAVAPGTFEVKLGNAIPK